MGRRTMELKPDTESSSENILSLLGKFLNFLKRQVPTYTNQISIRNFDTSDEKNRRKVFSSWFSSALQDHIFAMTFSIHLCLQITKILLFVFIIILFLNSDVKILTWLVFTTIASFFSRINKSSIFINNQADQTRENSTVN